MRLVAAVICAGLLCVSSLDAQTKKTSPKKAPAKTAPAKKAVPAVPLARIQADSQCPSELGVGVTTTRKFCDVLTGREPKDGMLITIPPHRGPVTLSFELHNRHTYSAELVKPKQAYRKYTATIGVLSMDNTLVDRAVIQSEFRTEKDLFDRISGGVGPGGMKAVAPYGRRVRHDRTARGHRGAGVDSRREVERRACRGRRQLQCAGPADCHHQQRDARVPPRACRRRRLRRRSPDRSRQ